MKTVESTKRRKERKIEIAMKNKFTVKEKDKLNER